MKKNLYLSCFLLGIPLIGYSQGSEIYSDTQIDTEGRYEAYGTLVFTSGYFLTPRPTPSSNVYFTTGSGTTGQSDASHVNGYVEKEGTTSFTFPIGDGVTLRTAGISAPASSTRYQAAYFKVNPNAATLPSGQMPTANRASDVQTVSTVEYWDVNGSLATNLTLTWNAASDLNTLTSGDLTKLIVVGYNPTTSEWENLGAAGTTGNLTTGSITANGITLDNYSAYTFGVFRNPMPVDLLSFQGRWIEKLGNQLNWVTAWENNNAEFQIQSSLDAKSYETIGHVTGKGTTHAQQTYGFVDTNPQAELTYYRLKQVDVTGKFTYSRIVGVQRDKVDPSFVVYPNPTSDVLLIKLSGQTISEIMLYDLEGRRILHQIENTSHLQLSVIKAGTYVIEVKTKQGVSYRQRFIKQ